MAAHLVCREDALLEDVLLLAAPSLEVRDEAVACTREDAAAQDGSAPATSTATVELSVRLSVGGRARIAGRQLARSMERLSFVVLDRCTAELCSN